MLRSEYREKSPSRMNAILDECAPDELEPDREVPYVGLTISGSGPEGEHLVEDFAARAGLVLKPVASILSILEPLAASAELLDGGTRWSEVEIGRQQGLASQAGQLLDSIMRNDLVKDYDGSKPKMRVAPDDDPAAL